MDYRVGPGKPESHATYSGQLGLEIKFSLEFHECEYDLNADLKARTLLLLQKLYFYA